MKVVAVFLVAVWLALLGVELVEGSRLAKQGARDFVAPMEAAISSLGKAEICDDKWTGELDGLVETPVFAVTQSIPFDERPGSVKFIKNRVPIYTLHVTFLI